MPNSFPEFKIYLSPSSEALFEYSNQRLKKEGARKEQKLKDLTVNLLDQKAVELFDEVFKNDPWYQARRKKIKIIAKKILPKNKKSNIFGIKTGRTEEWRKIVEKYKNKMAKTNPADKLWQDLGRRCIECGQCTIACPTCFCFRIDDQAGPEAGSGQRKKVWDSCFYAEFSELAGGLKFLKTTAERIHFWYYHKFVRIPEEYDLPGCVGCNRCSEVCPAGIEIKKVLARL